MPQEKFSRRVGQFLSVAVFLLLFCFGTSVSHARSGKTVAGVQQVSDKGINSDSRTGLGLDGVTFMFAFIFFLFVADTGLVLFWRRKIVFLSMARDRADGKAQAVFHRYELLQREHDALLDAVSDSVLFLTPDKKITRVNRSAESALGMDSSAIIGRSCHEIWHTLIGDGFLCPGRKCLASGVPERSVGWTPDKKQFEIRAVPVRDSHGKVVGIMEIGKDITRFSRFEQQLRQVQKVESIGLLTAGMVHDFNNILTGIVGFTYLLQKKNGGDETAHPYYANIISAAERAEMLSRSFLAFTRNQSVSMAPEDLNDVIRSVEGLLALVLGEDIDISLDLSASQAPVLADSLLLGQILVNLAVSFRNAVSGGGTFVIRTSVPSLSDGGCDAVFADSDDHVCLQVEDLRGSMNWQGAKALANAFGSVASSVEEDLGMAVVKGIVELHGGSIAFSCGSDAGAVFSILLPRYRNDLRECRKERSAADLSGENELILIVEDDRWARSFLGELLAGFGYRIIEAEDALEALEKFEESDDDIALVLCDIVLPKMNGRELCQKLVDSCRELKVLFMSGYPVEAIRSRGIDTAEITILPKPFKPQELLHAIRSTLHATGGGEALP